MTHTLTLNYSRDGEAITQNVAVTADGENNRDPVVAASATNTLVVVAFDVSAMKSLYIRSDKALTIKSNSSSEPDDTITLAANKPLVWYEGCGWDNPFSVDVTALYLSRTGGDAASGDAIVKIRELEDATP